MFIFVLETISILLFFGSSLFAQPVLDFFISDLKNDFVHNRWTTDDGLPVNSINSILQDHSGYIWLATYDGLVRFNGTSFKTFKRSDYPGLVNNRIDFIFEDSSERLWILGEYETVIKYENHEFTPYDGSNGFTNANADHIVEDKAGDIWIGTKDGVFRYSQNQLKHFTQTPVNYVVAGPNASVWIASGNSVQVIKDETVHDVEMNLENPLGEIIKLYFSQKNELWLITTDGIWKKSGSEFHHVVVDNSIASDEFAVFLEVEENELFIGGSNGFYHIEESNRIISDKHFLPNISIREMKKDSNGRIWIIAWNGELYLFNYTEESIILVSRELGFVDERVSGMMEDRAGNLWFIADPGGLHQLESAQVRHITTKQGLSVDNVISVFEDRDKQIWVGTRDGGLNLIKDKEIAVFGLKKQFPMTVVNTIAQQKNGRIWIGTYRNGLFTMNSDGSEIRKVQGVNKEFGVYAIHHSNNETWIGTEAGLIKITDNKLTLFDESDGLPHPFVRVIIEDIAGGLWLGTNGGGIAYFKNEKVQKICNKENGLSSNRIRTIHIDEKNANIIWVGSEDRGLTRIKNGEATIFLKKDGLHDEVIHQILEYDNTLWMSTNRGIFNVQKKEFNDFAEGNISQITSQVFGKSEGMLKIEGNGGSQFAGIKTSDKKLLFSTQAGIAVIAPDQFEQRSPPEFVLIEELVVKGKDYYQNQNLVFPEGTLSLEINFAALTYHSPSKIEFAYKTEGLENDWTYIGNRHVVYFYNLSYGTYTLIIRARNVSGTWSDSTASVTFSIQPHFYETGWFLFAMILAGIGIIVGLIKLRFNQLQKRQHLLETMIGERTEDLEREKLEVERQKEVIEELVQAKDHFFTNISHELRTPLTLVLGPLQQLNEKRNLSEEKRIRLLSTANQNGKRLQDLVEQVLDVTRLDSNNLDFNPIMIDIVRFLRRMVDSFESLADSKKIRLKFEIQLKELYLPVDKDKFQKIITNLLSNAVKFTPENGNITLSVNDRVDTVEITLTDSGCGIEEQHLSQIFDRFHSNEKHISGGGNGLGVGLALTKEYVMLHQGSITVKSKKNEGSVFTLNLPKLLFGVEVGKETESHKENETIFENDKVSLENPLYLNLEQEKKQHTVLVVEDNDSLREYVAELLIENKMKVETAINGIEGKKQLFLSKPDLIISDVMMPEMDGIDFVKQLRAVPEFQKIPIVMLTALAEEEDRIRAFEMGVSDYISKPFNEKELIVRIKNLLKLKREREEALKEQGVEKIEISEATRLVENLKIFIHRNISDNTLTVEQLCDEVNQSRRTLYRSLRVATGYTPAEFIREVRLEEARQILATKKYKTIPEVGFAVGFNTSQYFIKLFRQRFGVHPKKYLS